MSILKELQNTFSKNNDKNYFLYIKRKWEDGEETFAPAYQIEDYHISNDSFMGGGHIEFTTCSNLEDSSLFDEHIRKLRNLDLKCPFIDIRIIEDAHFNSSWNFQPARFFNFYDCFATSVYYPTPMSPKRKQIRMTFKNMKIQ
jgi:hypothetical protein